MSLEIDESRDPAATEQIVQQRGERWLAAVTEETQRYDICSSEDAAFWRLRQQHDHGATLIVAEASAVAFQTLEGAARSDVSRDYRRATYLLEVASSYLLHCHLVWSERAALDRIGRQSTEEDQHGLSAATTGATAQARLDSPDWIWSQIVNSSVWLAVDNPPGQPAQPALEDDDMTHPDADGGVGSAFTDACGVAIPTLPDVWRTFFQRKIFEQRGGDSEVAEADESVATGPESRRAKVAPPSPLTSAAVLSDAASSLASARMEFLGAGGEFQELIELHYETAVVDDELTDRALLVSLMEQTFFRIRRIETWERRELAILEEIHFLESLFGVGVAIADGRARLHAMLLADHELDTRERIEAEEITLWRLLDTSHAEGAEWAGMMQRDRSVRLTVRQHTSRKAPRILDQRRVACLADQRFKAWLAFAAPRTFRRRVAQRVEIMAAVAQRVVLRRYCNLWSRPMQTRTETIARNALVEAESLLRGPAILAEEELHGRMVVEFDERHRQRGVIMDAFHKVIDDHREQHLTSARQTIQMRAEWRHRMRRLIVWHRFWKTRAGLRKVRWLLQQHQAAECANVYRTWRCFYDCRAKLRSERRALQLSESLSRDAVQLEGACDALRLVNELEEAVGFTALWGVELREYRASKEREKVAHAQRLCRLNERVLLQIYARRWRKVLHKRTHVMYLLGATETDHERRRFRSWLAATRETRVVRSEMPRLFESASAEAQLIVEDQREGRDRIEVEFGRELFLVRLTRLVDRKLFPPMHFARGMLMRSVRRPSRHASTEMSVSGRAYSASNFLSNRITTAEAVEQFRNEVQNDARFSAYIRWGDFVVWRHHTRNCAELIRYLFFQSEHERIRVSMTRWRTFSHQCVESRQAAAQQSELLQRLRVVEVDEDGARAAVSEAAEWAATRLVLSKQRAEKALRVKHQLGQVLRLEANATHDVIRSAFRKWSGLLQRRERRRRLERGIVRRLEVDCHRRIWRRYFHAWRAAAHVRRRPQALERMRSAILRKLLERYYAKLNPSTVRQRRLQAAAAATMSTEGSKPPKVSLPPLQRSRQPAATSVMAEIIHPTHLGKSKPAMQPPQRSHEALLADVLPALGDRGTVRLAQRPPSPVFKTVRHRCGGGVQKDTAATTAAASAAPPPPASPSTRSSALPPLESQGGRPNSGSGRASSGRAPSAGSARRTSQSPASRQGSANRNRRTLPPLP